MRPRIDGVRQSVAYSTSPVLRLPMLTSSQHRYEIAFRCYNIMVTLVHLVLCRLSVRGQDTKFARGIHKSL